MRFVPPAAVLALALALSGAALADDPSPAKPADAKPADAADAAEEKLVLGEINAANVNVRAGNTMNHRIVCVANRGDKVLIAGESGDFYKILAPKSSACWVSCQFVDRHGDSGTVHGDNVNLRPTPDTSHPVFGKLNPGDTVKITGQDSVGTWFKIEPPKSVFAYVSKKFVAVKGDYAQIQSEDAKKESEKIAIEEKSKATVTAWQKAEALLKAQNDMDPASRDYTEAMTAFGEIAQSATDPKTAERAKEKSEYLGKLQELQNLVKSLDQTSQVQKDDYDKKIAELEQKWQAEQAAKSVKKTEDKNYIAQGWVEDVGSLFGRPGTHKVVEAGVTLFYLHSDTLDLRRYWHNRVRITKGTVKTAPEGWEDGPKVIEVEALDVLE
ncbi:MAG: SH3 domain-containing protein [Planctomycetes bacterium]|nr:SH3 domain-containing protein [Planctomycetota bacterium]